MKDSIKPLEPKLIQVSGWSMFKNYIHNELGISKDDIRLKQRGLKMNRVTDVVEKWRIGDHLFSRKYLSTQYKTKKIRYGILLLRCKRTDFCITATRYDAKRGQRMVNR